MILLQTMAAWLAEGQGEGQVTRAKKKKKLRFLGVLGESVQKLHDFLGHTQPQCWNVSCHQASRCIK